MNQAQLERFVSYLQTANWLVFGPKELPKDKDELEEISPFIAAHLPAGKAKTGFTLIGRITRPAELALDNRLPFYSFKRFFVPDKEVLFEYQDTALLDKKTRHKVALLGMSILDLTAVNLYDQVFEKDAYYQTRRRQLLLVGHSAVPEIANNIFERQYEEDILEHLPFDIFLAEEKRGKFKVFSGSLKGQRVLEHFGYSDYEHVQFSGPVKEGKIDARLDRLRNRLKKHHNPQIWEELAKKCIECGKCTLVCPTCFCFRIDDKPSLGEKSGQRKRCWDSCFYREFSEVGGGHKFLDTTAERIHFWYFHKFARIPDEFDFMGCVGCHRCANVCPVGIDIVKVLKDIEEK